MRSAQSETVGVPSRLISFEKAEPAASLYWRVQVWLGECQEMMAEVAASWPGAAVRKCACVGERTVMVQTDFMLGLAAIAAVMVALRLLFVVLYAVTLPLASTVRMLLSLLVQMRSGAVSVFLKVGLKVWVSPGSIVRLVVPRETVMFFLGGV